MQIPIDSELMSRNVKGASGYEPVMDFDSGKQKLVGSDDEKRLAWAIHIVYEDPTDAYGEPENLKFRFNSNSDPKIVFGPIELGGIKAQTWQVATKGGQLKNGISFSCDTFTQQPAPSTKRAPAEPPAPAGKK